MANIRVRQALARICKDLERTMEYTMLYSGISAGELHMLDDIVIHAARLAEMVRQTHGSKQKPGTIVRKVRRTLGFTSP